MKPGGEATVPDTPTVNRSTPTAGNSFTLSGAVAESKGEGIPEVAVRFSSRDVSVDPKILRSDPDGAFSAEGIVPGRWSVELKGVGYLPIRADIVVRGDTDITAYLVPQPARYRSSAIDLMPPEEPLPPE
jgi:hypothetical protein